MLNLSDYPTLTQEAKAGSTSDRYSFISTMTIIDDLKNAGWYPIEAQEANARVNKGFQKHLVRFQNDSLISKNGKFRPNIVMTTAHDGKASFKLMGGGINFVCLNGLIVADSIVSEHTIRHQGYTEEIVKEAVYNIVEDMPKVYNSIERFQDVQLDSDERFAFSKGALLLTYEDEQLEKIDLDESARLLSIPKRPEEHDSNLWNNFNIVQEKLIRGGRFLKTKIEGDTVTDRYNSNHVRPKKRRATKSIDTNVAVNRALWAYAEALADLKKA